MTMETPEPDSQRIVIAELRAVMVLGEAVSLALAQHRGRLLASDEKPGGALRVDGCTAIRREFLLTNESGISIELPEGLPPSPPVQWPGAPKRGAGDCRRNGLVPWQWA